MLRSLRTDTVARNGGCLNVGSKARSGPSGGERKAGEGWAGQNPTWGGGPEWVREQRFKALLGDSSCLPPPPSHCSIPNVSGKHLLDWN